MSLIESLKKIRKRVIKIPSIDDKDLIPDDAECDNCKYFSGHKEACFESFSGRKIIYDMVICKRWGKEFKEDDSCDYWEKKNEETN